MNNESIIVGKPLEEALATLTRFKFDYRVVCEDGQDTPITSEYNENRVNLTVVNNIVTEYFIG